MTPTVIPEDGAQGLVGALCGRPRAARGKFPYPHRTIAEIDRRAAGVAAVALDYRFCAQCDRRVRSDEADQCASPFCPTAKALA